MRYLIVAFMLPMLFIGCEKIIESMEGDEYSSKKIIGGSKNSDHLSVILSGNINGETHPCGCRHFPLGGLAQAYGLMEKLKKEKGIVYVDAGDTFFGSQSVSDFQKESKIFTAKQLVIGLNNLGLKYFVPGDQDFAAGSDVFFDIMKQAKFTLLAANFKAPKQKLDFKFKAWDKIEKGGRTVFFIGAVNPRILRSGSELFSDPFNALKSTFSEIKKNGYDPKNKSHTLVFITSGGASFEENVIRSFPEIDWSLGAHNQNFNKFPAKFKETKMIQMLSRNHYIGEIRIPFSDTPSNDFIKNEYIVHEVRDELAKEVSNNPFFEFLDKYKAEVKIIQTKEEENMSSAFASNAPIPTANSCLGCHQQQGEKWFSTDHSVAYSTLIRVNEEKKGECIECHTLDYGKAFKKTSEIALFDAKPNQDRLENYWKAFRTKFKDLPVVRELATEKVSEFGKSWKQFDDEQGVTHQYANVQCLNCHGQSPEHPFEMNKVTLSKNARKENIKTNCLNCHTPDQSPQWYKDGKALNDEVFNTHYKEIACPSIEK